jgi:hypothetical protein
VRSFTGGIRANRFQVQNPFHFIRWLEGEVQFSQGDVGWQYDHDYVSFGGYGADADAHPRHRKPDDQGSREPWDLDELAAQFRRWLTKPQEIRVVAVARDGLKRLSASTLIIPADGRPVLFRFASDDDELLVHLREQAASLLRT